MKHPLIFLVRTLLCTLSALFALSVCETATCGQACARGSEPADKTLAPYFFVKSEDRSTEHLPLKSNSVSVNISGFIADVTVVQAYKNEGSKPIEAIYVFPASTRASVYGMKMTIGDRTVAAEIQKRQDARKAYERAKQEGKSASLLEQNRPNVFQMNVANILPGDEIKTELHYTEIIVPTDNIYEFVYPTVVGPRYSNQRAEEAPDTQKWTRNPYLHEGEPPTYSFAITARVNAGMPIQEISCPSHKTDIAYLDKNTAEVNLDSGERSGGNRDYILRYRLAGDRIESGLLLYEGKDENFFLLTGQPPKRVTPDSMPPREYIFVVDVSGSMYGFPLEISKNLIENLITGLRSSDMFNVMTFSGGSSLLSERSLPASPDNIRRAVALLREQQGGGGTELLPAMQRVLALPRTEKVSRTIVIATDGYISVEPEVFDLIREHIGNANIFPFGIGKSVNRHLIEGMARVGAGEPFVVTRPEEAPGIAERFRKYVQSPVLTQIKVDFGDFQVYDVIPSGVPDIFAERPAVVFGKWRGKPQGIITLSGLSGRGSYQVRFDVSGVPPREDNAALRYLWARSQAALLSDYNLLRNSDERVKQVTELGLKYNLLTAYTSFVAVDSEVRRKEGDTETVKQPLPLPEGVSDNALPGNMMSTGAMAAAPGSFAVPEFTKAKMGRPGTEPFETADVRTGAAPETSRGLVLSIEKLTVRGGLSKDAVRQAVERELESLRECFGKIVPVHGLILEWTIDKAGSVVRMNLSPNRGMDKNMLACIEKRMMEWSFPAPKDGREVIVTARIKVNGQPR